MHIGGFPPKIYGLLFLLSLRNDVQYCIASVEGPSYCCGIHEVQRYVREIQLSIFFLVYYVSIHVICSFTLALGLFHCFVQFYICNQHISFFNLCIWMFGACSAFLFPTKELLVWEIILTSLKIVSNSVHGEPLLGVIRVCYNIALHRYFLLLFFNRFPISISSSANEL